jgi:hypothetical protein
MCYIRYPLRYGSIICTVISLLLLSPLVYLAGGSVGVYETLFDENDAHNATSAAQRGFNILYEAHQTGESPPAFRKWGVVALILYFVLVATVGIALCVRTTWQWRSELEHMSSSEMHELGAPHHSLRDDYLARQDVGV